MIERPTRGRILSVTDPRFAPDKDQRLTRLITTSEHLRMTLDQLLEDMLSVVRRLMHRDVAVAVSEVDAVHARSRFPSVSSL